LDSNDLLQGMAKAQSATVTPVDFMRFTEPIPFQKIAYASIRNMFCDGLDEHFSFADYLNRRLGSHLGELVEVPVKTWGGLWVFMFACYLLHDALPLPVQVRAAAKAADRGGAFFINATCVDLTIDARFSPSPPTMPPTLPSPHVQAVILIMIAYSLPIIMRHIHGKLRLIKYDACDLAMVRQAEQMSKQGAGVEEGSNLLSAGSAASSGAIEGARSDTVPTGPENLWMHACPIEYTVKG